MWLPRPIQAGALLAGALASSVAAPIAGLYDQIPAVASYTQAPGGGTFHVTHATQIVVDAASAHSGAPSLLAFATTFRADLIAVLDLSSLPPVAVRAANATTASANSILLTLDAMDHTLFSGAPTDEGYALTIAPRGAVVAGAGTRGAWWGTRTLLQQLVAAGAGAGAGAGLRAGTVRDAPGWPVRVVMLDAGRHWYEPGFIGTPFLQHTWIALTACASGPVRVRVLLQAERAAPAHVRQPLGPELPVRARRRVARAVRGLPPAPARGLAARGRRPARERELGSRRVRGHAGGVRRAGHCGRA
jgi:hypothetical protein